MDRGVFSTGEAYLLLCIVATGVLTCSALEFGFQGGGEPGPLLGDRELAGRRARVKLDVRSTPVDVGVVDLEPIVAQEDVIGSYVRNVEPSYFPMVISFQS